MKSKSPIVSKHTLASYAVFLFVPATLPAIVAFFLYKNCVFNPYWDVFELLFATAALALSVWFYWLIATIHNLHINDEELILKSWLGYPLRTIYLKDITGWREIQHKVKGEIHTVLKLYTQHGTYSIAARQYKNYYIFKPRLIKGKPVVENWTIQFALRENRGAISLLVLMLLVCVSVVFSVLFNIGNQLPDALRTVTGTLVTAPEINRGSRSDNFSVSIKLKEYPGFRFDVYNHEAQATDINSLVTYAQMDARIQLIVPQADYEVKLDHLREPDFWEKHMSYNNIRVFGLSDYNHVYLQTGAETNPPYLNTQPAVIAFIIGLFAIISIARILITGSSPESTKT